jgi:hypothetical protein
VAKLIALEKEPMAWEADVRALKTPVLIITGDADVATLEHSVALFRLLGGGIMGDMGQPPAGLAARGPAGVVTHRRLHPDRAAAGLYRAVLEGRDAKEFFPGFQRAIRVIGRLVPHRPTPYNCHCSSPFTHPNEGGDPLSSPREVRNLVWASDRLIGS